MRPEIQNSPQSSPHDALKLFICRHAKASRQEMGLSDFDRPLNARGERDAALMGRRLSRRGARPDLILSSPAARALATAGHYAGQLGIAPTLIRRNPAQYAASVPALLALIRAVDPGVGALMLVGHNPESTDLANALGGLSIDNIPTGGVVALAFSHGVWADVQAGGGSLVFFDYPGADMGEGP